MVMVYILSYVLWIFMGKLVGKYFEFTVHGSYGSGILLILNLFFW